jgi:hypothetical protein
MSASPLPRARPALNPPSSPPRLPPLPPIPLQFPSFTLSCSAPSRAVAACHITRLGRRGGGVGGGEGVGGPGAVNAHASRLQRQLRRADLPHLGRATDPPLPPSPQKTLIQSALAPAEDAAPGAPGRPRRGERPAAPAHPACTPSCLIPAIVLSPLPGASLNVFDACVCAYVRVCACVCSHAQASKHASTHTWIALDRIRRSGEMRAACAALGAAARDGACSQARACPARRVDGPKDSDDSGSVQRHPAPARRLHKPTPSAHVGAGSHGPTVCARRGHARPESDVRSVFESSLGLYQESLYQESIDFNFPVVATIAEPSKSPALFLLNTTADNRQRLKHK